jgi:acyl carrier protein
MKSREEIFTVLSGYLVDMFEVPEEDITLEARLYEDLDLDSIDAVDLVVQLQDLTGKKISPKVFKAVRTVEDVVVSVDAIVNGK